jgi:hypothetical protein
MCRPTLPDTQQLELALEAMETDQAERLAMFLTPIRPPLRDRKFADSLLEGDGFEPSVPL